VDAGVAAVSRFGPVSPVQSHDTPDPAVKRLVTSDFFLFDEVRPVGSWEVGGDDSCHVLAVLDGTLAFDDHWSLPPVGRGRTVLMPAAIGRQKLTVLPGPAAKLLHIALP
jgi:hypothetical protein